jgi:hypothetical protein
MGKGVSVALLVSLILSAQGPEAFLESVRRMGTPMPTWDLARQTAIARETLAKYGR